MRPDLREDRQAAVRALLEPDGLQALIVTHLPNIRYLTGFTGSSGAAILLPDEVVLVTDFRYETQATDEVGSAARVEIVPTDVWGRVKKVIDDAPGISEVGLEAENMSVATAQRLSDGDWSVAARPVRGPVEQLRASKHPSEVESIRQAACLTKEAFEEVTGAIRPGVAELTIAAELERALRLRGSEWHPFQTIVASGPRSALPHARTGDRELRSGDFVLLDFGAQVDGYCADLTRTVVLGAADERQRTVYEIVRSAQADARSHVRAGMTGADADALARSSIAARGFGDAFGHSLGHGLGLEVHEAPRLGRTNDKPLPADAVVTIEPGVYFPGWGGVRIEDDVHLSDEGAVLLSDGETELRELR